MPQLDKLVFTSADYKINWVIPGAGAFPLLSAETFGSDIAAEEETIYAIGTTEPIANKTNGVKYTGKLSLQTGELNAILQIAGKQHAAQINGTTLAITAIVGGYSRVYTNLNITREALDVKAKDKQTLTALDWTALGIQ